MCPCAIHDAIEFSTCQHQDGENRAIKLGKNYVVSKCPRANLKTFDLGIIDLFDIFHDFDGQAHQCILNAEERATLPATVWMGWQALRHESALIMIEDSETTSE